MFTFRNSTSSVFSGLPHKMLWASCQIRKNTGCACAGNAGNVFPRRQFQRKLLYSDPGMHHGTCVTHVPWCMSGSLTCGDGENVPGIPGACATAILRIWQEAHAYIYLLWQLHLPIADARQPDNSVHYEIWQSLYIRRRRRSHLCVDRHCLPSRNSITNLINGIVS